MRAVHWIAIVSMASLISVEYSDRGAETKTSVNQYIVS